MAPRTVDLEKARLAENRARSLSVAIGCVCSEITAAVDDAEQRASLIDREPDFQQVIDFDESHVEGIAAALPTLIVLFNAHLKDMRLPEAA